MKRLGSYRRPRANYRTQLRAHARELVDLARAMKEQQVQSPRALAVAIEIYAAWRGTDYDWRILDRLAEFRREVADLIAASRDLTAERAEEIRAALREVAGGPFRVDALVERAALEAVRGVK